MYSEQDRRELAILEMLYLGTSFIIINFSKRITLKFAKSEIWFKRIFKNAQPW